MLRRAGRSEARTPTATSRSACCRCSRRRSRRYGALDADRRARAPCAARAPPASAVACCTVLPSRKLRSQVEARETAIRRQLPDVMDLLIICMEAGLGFTSAVTRTVANLDGPLSDEFALVLGDMRAGASRSDALAGLAERVHLPEVAILRARRSGKPTSSASPCRPCCATRPRTCASPASRSRRRRP